jgi:ubiquinone/menaquinone biosynthesis C-methylase UbiE
MTPSQEQQARSVDAIRQRVVDMYSRHPWPSTREADEEMGWRLKMLGIAKGDYAGRRILDLGCGTGEYALWYATNGAREVVGVDLSKGSLELAEEKRRASSVSNATFLERDILSLDLPSDSFDYSYSVGVLHHTGDPGRGFEQLCRVTKPGGVVIVSLYNRYSRFFLRIEQSICKLLGGDDIDKRARIGRRLFPWTMRALDKRYHETNYEAISYDIYGFPHESVHTVEEVLGWFDRHNIEYLGSFAPLRLGDYFYAYSLPEYHAFKKTFAGFWHVQMISAIMNKIATVARRDDGRGPVAFQRPGRLSMLAVQLIWFVIGTRINCFTISGRKRA